MLSRFLSKPSYHFRLLTLLSSKSHTPPIPNSTLLLQHFRFFSSNNNNNDQSTSNTWKFTPGKDVISESFFTDDAGNLAGITDFDAREPKRTDYEALTGDGGQRGVDIFDSIDSREPKSDKKRIDYEAWTGNGGERGGEMFDAIEAESAEKSGGDDWLNTAEEGGYKPWNLAEEEKGDRVFGDVGVGPELVTADTGESSEDAEKKKEEMMKLEAEATALTDVLKGPNRAFGDLIAASGITDAMLDSLIALKDFEGVVGLPPLSEIEDARYEKNTRKSTRAEIERQKQEEVSNARVRKVDDKGRAYGTGRRKCSIARVFIQPGEGKFAVNDKEFDVYFPMLDHRAALLRPFAETKTLGLWDIECTVKGGGVSGQVGAIRLGISRALQNWEPGLRPALRDAGFLTRDPRVVERKKPGKAKARKSFQWVKR